MGDTNISILYPKGYEDNFTQLSETTIHDLGLDAVCKNLSNKESEQKLVLKVLQNMTDDPEVAQFRLGVFNDIYENPKMRDDLMVILDKINFLKDYSSFKREYEESASTWDLLHRLDEIRDYISCVEAIDSCLKDARLNSKGLNNLLEYVEKLYADNGFAELKEDISKLNATTDNLKSVTLGVNLNGRFEAESIGVISINSKPFTKPNILNNFCDMIISKDSINNDTEWDNNYKYQPISVEDHDSVGVMEHVGRVKVAMAHPLTVGMAMIPNGDSSEDMTRYLDRVTDHMLAITVKKLKEVLKKYVTITITDITNLIPEFIYYIRWAEYIDKNMNKGLHFCKPVVANVNKNARYMSAKGIYNLKLVPAVTKEKEEIVTNDLDFDKEHRVYILTGANRGGKTTITQAIGQLYVLAQGGIFVPGDSFEFSPVDNICTHFPADEDKTLDLGRLGEECKRFRQMYYECTSNSLLLLNETFSTTSFEEGYYIAKDSVKAILAKGIRTIYNTHMHKLAFDIEEINSCDGDGKASSLIVQAKEGKRSFKVVVAPPEGMSYAKDVAKKYGVTYEMLVHQF